jgi:glycosyltransferase involved in cell wall biosynthesis
MSRHKKKKQRATAATEHRSTICLNMIVKNEAHIIHELFKAVEPYIDYWVIVDTGSDDGTPALIPTLMEEHGIPGEIHEKPWKDFGHNRSEALFLAQGHCDYIWVMDADDTIVGDPGLGLLTADAYSMRIQDGLLYWRLQLFKDGLPWRYEGVLHELATCDASFRDERLEGDYYIHSRRLGGRNKDPNKYQKDVEVLLAEVEKNPEDARSVFYLAQSYVSAGLLKEGKQWYLRRVEIGGWEEEIYYSLFCVASLMERLEEPWPLVLDAYLKAWTYRPCRAEPLYAIAKRYRIDQNYQLGYLFAEKAAQIPLPEADVLFVSADIYTWHALDEQAVCASWTSKPAECFNICRDLLSIPTLPVIDRQRIAGNRDLVIPQLLQAVVSYPEHLAPPISSGEQAEITMTLIAGPNRIKTERCLNSFLHCCLDHERVNRFLILDMGLSVEDRFQLLERYRFLEFMPCSAMPLTLDKYIEIGKSLGGAYWLHLSHDWQFFVPELVIGRLRGVLNAEPDVVQVGINDQDATKPTGTSPSEQDVRRTEAAGRYLLREDWVMGPSMISLNRLDMLNTRKTIQLPTQSIATLDEVLCLKIE